MPQACKPGSVPRLSAECLSFIWSRSHNRDLSAYPSRLLSDLQWQASVANRDLFGLSAPEVYPHCMLPYSVVRSYHTFSPLSRLLGTVIFCGTISSGIADGDHLLGGRMPLAARTFLPALLRSDRPTCGNTKVIKIKELCPHAHFIQ
jgi:hypothetical protein